jgi:hypothetical protein
LLKNLLYVRQALLLQVCFMESYHSFFPKKT